MRTSGEGLGTPMDLDDNESFGPIKTAQTAEGTHRVGGAIASLCVVETCISFLAVVPILETSSGEPTRDKELTQLVLDCSYERLFLVGPIFFSKIRQRILNLSPNNLKNFLEKLGFLVTGNYTYGRCEKVLLLLIHFLQSTLHIWVQESVRTTDVGKDIGQLLHWLSKLIRNKHARSWKVRDAIAIFFDVYLSQDPRQKVWKFGDLDSQEIDSPPLDTLPFAMLPCLSADVDIRVRFRAAVVNARLFSIAQSLDLDSMALYSDILQCLTKEIDE